MGAKVLFIGNYTDENTYKVITQKGIRDLSQAARLFQHRLLSSLSRQTDNLKAISVLPTDSLTVLPNEFQDIPVTVEVIPVANGSMSSLTKAMRRIRDLVIHECGKDTKVLMYIGYREANGDILFFIDDDAIVISEGYSLDVVADYIA